jgi:hypothetical protein
MRLIPKRPIIILIMCVMYFGNKGLVNVTFAVAVTVTVSYWIPRTSYSTPLLEPNNNTNVNLSWFVERLIEQSKIKYDLTAAIHALSLLTTAAGAASIRVCAPTLRSSPHWSLLPNHVANTYPVMVSFSCEVS